MWLCRGSLLGWRHISLFGLPYISSTTIKYSTSSNTGTRRKRGWKPQTGREFQHQRILKLIFLPDQFLHFTLCEADQLSWVFFCPQICDVSSTQAADEPSQQRGRTQGQSFYLIEIFCVANSFLCHGDYFAMWFGGSLPRLISINPTPPPLAPHQWKNPIYPTKRGLASLAHIIVRNWPQPSSSSSPMVILKIQIHESNDEFLWTKNNFAIFQAVISNMKVTLSLSPSLRWINLKTKMIFIKLMC